MDAAYRIMYTCPFCKDWQVDYLAVDPIEQPVIEAILGEHILECPSPEAIPAAVRAGHNPARLVL